MADRDVERKPDGVAPPPIAYENARGLRAGGLIDIFGIRHRIVAIVGNRAFASALLTGHPYLVQEEDGSLQLPTLAAITSMIENGTAALAYPPDARRVLSPSARMSALISMLDAADVANGEKAIWLHLATHWTPDLEAAFGKPDEPWKIRRWRTALRRAVRQRDQSDRAASDRR